MFVPLDGSEFAERTLPSARLVASSMSVSIELLGACQILAPAVLDTQTRHIVKVMLLQRQRRSKEYLKGVRYRLEASGKSTPVSTVRGAPADAIVTCATTYSRALVIMSTHGTARIAPWILGCVTENRCRLSPTHCLSFAPRRQNPRLRLRR